MRRELFFSLLVFFWIGAVDAGASETAAVETMLKDKVDQALTILRQHDMDIKARQQAIVAIVEPLFDFPLMAKLVLGKKHWFKLTGDQQRRFEALFVERLKSSYIEKIDLYSDETVSYRPTVEAGPDKVYIPAVILSKDKEIVILYKLYRNPAGWKIFDVEVQGVSIVTTFRSQFDQILNTGTVADLFKELEKPQTP